MKKIYILLWYVLCRHTYVCMCDTSSSILSYNSFLPDDDFLGLAASAALIMLMVAWA